MEPILLTILGQPPSMKNDLRPRAGGGFYHANNSVKKYKRDFALQVPEKYKINYDQPVCVDLHIVRRDKRTDGHNLTMICYDALQSSGVIKNDRQIVRGYFNCEEIDADNPRVEIAVIPIYKC